MKNRCVKQALYITGTSAEKGNSIMENYIIRKIGMDKNEVTSVGYSNLEEAIAAFEALGRDNTEIILYNVLYDRAKNLVLRVLCFDGNGIVSEIHDGDVVRLREEFCEPNEAKNLYTVTDINENMGRCLIISLNSGMSIAPSETVGLEMIESICHIA